MFADGAAVPTSAPLVHSAVTTDVDSTLTSVTNFFLRGNVSESQGVTVDEVRVGTTFADVVPEPAALVTTLAGIGLAMRRRR